VAFRPQTDSEKILKSSPKARHFSFWPAGNIRSKGVLYMGWILVVPSPAEEIS